MAKDKTAQDKLNKIMSSMNKKFGSGAVMMTGGDDLPIIPRVPFDSPKMAEVFGGGLPIGRIIEIYGPESAGKTSLASYIAGQVQKHQFTKNGITREGRVAFVDAEYALDHKYAETFGWDVKKSFYCQPENGEDGLQMVSDLVETDEFELVIVDSVAALIPEAELVGEVGDQQMGLQARMMGKGLRKLLALTKKKSCTVIFINQIRMSMKSMGNPETTPGGRALPFFASIRISIRGKDKVYRGEEAIGLNNYIKAIKNKTAPPQRRADLTIIFGEGFTVSDDWIEFACKYDVIQKGGAGWMTMPDGTKKQGFPAAIAYLKELGIYDDIILKTKQAMFPGQYDDEKPIKLVEEELTEEEKEFLETPDKDLPEEITGDDIKEEDSYEEIIEEKSADEEIMEALMKGEAVDGFVG